MLLLILYKWLCKGNIVINADHKNMFEIFMLISFNPHHIVIRLAVILQFNSFPIQVVQAGQRVIHGKFGEGVILNYEGQGSNARVQVSFDAVGSKWLVLQYANLQLM